MTSSMKRRTLLVGGALLALAGCGKKEEKAAKKPERDTPAVELESTDLWAKAADKGSMTAAFGQLRNHTNSPMMLTGVAFAGAKKTELHETVKGSDGGMQMRQKEGGFEIPAGGSLTLEPGGNHIMLMGLTEDLKAGEEIEITLEFAGGHSEKLSFPVRVFTGAKENYGGDKEMKHMDGMDKKEGEGHGDK
ncbi:copper chaperone PCu(A)C [Dermabacteraceae bacterium TAE3-ERU27]|nr:copper chaperone PCu(A)C [Dermabacteraceae bacterium TAE3-ERU27]